MDEKEKFYKLFINIIMNKEEEPHNICVSLHKIDGKKFVYISKDLNFGDTYEYATDEKLKEIIANYVINMIKEDTNA